MPIEPGTCEIWLTNDAEAVKLLLPVLPEEFSAGYGNDLKSQDIIGLGELITKGDRPAVTVKFSSFFPGAPFNGLRYEWVDPKQYKESLVGFERSKYPSHLLITYTDINMYCYIDKLNFHEEGGDIGTIYYDIELVEFRQVEPRMVKVDPITQVATVPRVISTRPDNRVTPATYVMKEGDSLQKIADAIFGNQARWQEIYDLNRSNIPHPMLIPTGTVLQLPQ